MRLIDADKLYPECLTKDGKFAISQSQIAKAPTVEERPQGEWGKHGECPFCSYILENGKMIICGNCGADMRKGGKSNETNN